MGEAARQYPRTLVNVAKLAFGRPALSLRLIGVVESKSALKGRVKRILERPLPKSAKLGIAGLIMVLFFGSILLPMAKFEPGPPNFIVKGTVTDADTGKPVAGAKVGDNKEYNDGKFCTVTDSDGNYEYKTWYEEHFTKCEAAGYKTEKKILMTKLFGSEKEKVIDFELTRGEDSGPSEFKASLAGGVTVELVGVCDYPDDKARSWRPDGSKLEKQIYATKWNKKSPKAGEFGFIFKLDGPEDLSFSWNGIKGAESLEGSCKVVDNQGKLFEDFEAAIAFFRNEVSETSLKIGIATGSWKTVAANSGKAMCIINGIAFASPYEPNGDVRIVVTDSLGNEVVPRVIAIDEDGNIHSSKGSSGSVSSQNLRQTTANFPGLEINRVKEFQFQTRPYEWVTFKNVSLNPNFKTDVQIEVEPIKKADVQVDAEQDHSVFESYFPDDAEAGEQLDRLYEVWSEQGPDSEKLPHSDRQILETVRKGLRRTTKHKTLVLRLVGNRFIWGKSPQNEQAIDLMYRATYSPDSDIRHYAEYFGLSVVEHKDTQILKRLAQLCVNYKETDTGRIIWGVYMSDQQHEFMSELKPYLEKYGSEIYRRADYFAKAVRGEIPVDELQETYRKNWNRKQTADPSFSPAGQAGGEKPTAKYKNNTSDEVVYKQLEEIVELSGLSTDMAFAEAIEEIKHSVDPPLRIVVMWRDLFENADIDQTTPINMDAMPAVRLGMALRLLLDSVSEFADLGFVVRDGVIIISTKESLPTILETRVYDISELVSKEAEAHHINMLVINTIAPDSWQGEGGGEGRADVYQGKKLVVSQTYGVHREIQKLLQGLQASPDMADEVEGEIISPQILTSSYILSVPADLPQLEDIISDGKSKMITPEKLEEFLDIARNTPQARMISAPKFITNDGEVGEIRTGNAEEFESVELRIKNTVQPDRKTVRLELDCEYSVSVGQDVSSTSVSTTAAVLSEHAAAVACNPPIDGQTILFLVKPQILERQFSKTGIVQTENHPGQLEKFKRRLEEAVTVHIDNSPDGDRLTIQYKVRAICKAAGVPYQWEKSAELADPQRRQYTEPVHIKDVPAKDALADILGPFGLSYSLDEAGLYLHKTDSEAKETVKVGKADKLAAENLTAESRMVSQNPVGRWRSVDFVREMEEFEPGVKSWPGDLYLKDLEFMKDGRTSGPCTWKKGSLWHPGDRTKAKYVIKEIDGVKYLFMEWISGDVTKRGRKPWYYVLKRVD
jgi:hypothetical protein